MQVKERIYMKKLSMVVSKFLNINIEFLGVIPQDSYITKAIMKQKPVSIMYPMRRLQSSLKRLQRKCPAHSRMFRIQEEGSGDILRTFLQKECVKGVDKYVEKNINY